MEQPTVDELIGKVQDRLSNTGSHDLNALMSKLDREARTKSAPNLALWSLLLSLTIAMSGAVVWGADRSINHEHRLTTIEAQQTQIVDAIKDLKASIAKNTDATQALTVELASRRGR